MAAVRALAALLVLAAVGLPRCQRANAPCTQAWRCARAAAADERLTPVRIVSRVGPQKPAPGATQESLRRPTPQDIFDDKPLEFDSDWLTPIGPEAGGKQKATIYVTNTMDRTIPAGTLLSIWANKTEDAKCGESGDVNYKLPKLLPRQTTTIKASWKVPDTPGKARVRFFIDSACAVFNESADFEQWTAPTTVLEAGTKYALLYLQNRQSDGNWNWEPRYPVRNGNFKANLGIINLGTEASEAGVKMAVYYDYSYDDVNITECTHTGQISVDLPKINPGKVKVVPVEGLKAADDSFAEIFVVLDATCKLFPEPVETPGMWGSTTEKAGALLGGVQKKDLSFMIKTSPKKPKANDTMTVKVKITNLGGADGSVGRVDIFTSPVTEINALLFPFIEEEERCNRPGSSYSFNTTDLVIKAGKSKTVKITDVPVPGTAGWSGLVVLPDGGCANEAEKGLFWQLFPFGVFEVVA